jgi:hypothetical protein
MGQAQAMSKQGHHLTLHLLVPLIEDKIMGAIFYTDQRSLIWGVKSRATNGWINGLLVTVPTSCIRHGSADQDPDPCQTSRIRDTDGMRHVQQISIPLPSWWKANRTVSTNYPGHSSCIMYRTAGHWIW